MGHIGGVTQQISPRHSLSPFGASVRNFQRRRTEQLEEVLGTGLREIKAFLHDLGNIDSKQFRESESPTRNPVNIAEFKGQMEELMSELNDGLQSVSKLRERLSQRLSFRNRERLPLQ